jgi:hypothetical protein
MQIPAEYIGHGEFLEMGIIQEFYPLTTLENAEKWIQEDILDHYKDEYRIHIVRTTLKTATQIQNACIRKGVQFYKHDSDDRLEIKTIFNGVLDRHVVLAIKGFFRRANLIPNAWKMRIGATHELYTKTVDNNTQIQALPGRMSGYWRTQIEAGHKTGPHRTSIQAVEEYEIAFKDPFGKNSYHSAGFSKRKGKVTRADPTMISVQNISGLGGGIEIQENDTNSYRDYSDEQIVIQVCNLLGYRYTPTNENEQGFKETSLNSKSTVWSFSEAVRKVASGYGTNDGVTTYRTYYPCYMDTNDPNTLRFVVIIRPGTNPEKLAEVDARFPRLGVKVTSLLTEKSIKKSQKARTKAIMK